MEAGKWMGEACKRIVVTFRHPEKCLCEGTSTWRTRSCSRMEPNDQIEICFFAKSVGFEDEVEERRFTFFLYEKTEKAQYVEEYAKLMYDAMRGDQTLFVSTREVDAGWSFIDPIVDAWEAGAVALDYYAAGDAEVVKRADEVLSAKSRRGQVGVAGLGKMGAGLALNLVDNGWEVVGFNRHADVARAMAPDGLIPAETLRDLAAALQPPRVIWLMVPSGAPVDELLFGADGSGGLAALLAPGDTVIDGGNTFFRDDASARGTPRRAGHPLPRLGHQRRPGRRARGRVADDRRRPRGLLGAARRCSPTSPCRAATSSSPGTARGTS